MAKYLLAIITLLLNFGICNADTLRGMVKDSNGNPIVFAQISLCGKQAKTYSNNDGFWILPAASPSDTVAVSHFRFQPIKRIVGSSNTMDIVLQKAINATPQVAKPTQWWFVGLGFATCGVAFMVDFVHDVCIDKRQFDCSRWD